MNRQILIAAVLGVLSLRGQGANNDMFQALGNLSVAKVLDEGFGSRLVKGKPFSATEERHFLQVLGDGTRIETSETNRLFRDAEGRARTEGMNGTATIYDPVANVTVELDPATKTARKRNGGNSFSYNFDFDGNAMSLTSMTPFGSSLVTGRAGQSNQGAMRGVMAETTENLGSQSINGVTAQGIRTTMTIPKGQIGNNKDIKVLTERWSSTDLQMLVKSINSDPRFGDTTYQLTKVVQSAPDPALFQIPAGYTVTDQKPTARGAGIGRGVGVGRGTIKVAPVAPAAPVVPAAPNPPVN